MTAGELRALMEFLPANAEVCVLAVVDESEFVSTLDVVSYLSECGCGHCQRNPLLGIAAHFSTAAANHAHFASRWEE